MEFIVALVALAIERFWAGSSLVRCDAWFGWYQGLWDKLFATKKFWTGYFKLFVLILPILLVLFFVQYAFWLAFNNIGWFVFALVVLLYSLGPGNLYGQASESFTSSEKGESSLNIENANKAFGLKLTEDNASARLTLSQTLLSVANQRIVTVIFWFALLGPVGALLYRLLGVCEAQASMKAQSQLLRSILAWVPARLLAFGYALTGNFITVTPVWLKNFYKGLGENDALLMSCARAAFGVKAGQTDKAIEPDQALALLDRSLVLWIIVLGLVVIL